MVRKETVFETSLTQEQIRAHEATAFQFVGSDSADSAIIHLTGDLKSVDGVPTFRISMLDVNGRAYNVVLHPDDLRALADAVSSRIPTAAMVATASNQPHTGESPAIQTASVPGQEVATAQENVEQDAPIVDTVGVSDSWDIQHVSVSRPQTDPEADAWSMEDPWESGTQGGPDQQSDYDRWLTAWDEAAA